MAYTPTPHAAAEALSRALRQGVTAAPRSWGANLDRALAGIEDTWRRSPPWGPPVLRENGVGDTASSPGVARKVERLRAEMARLAGVASSLRLQLAGLASGCQPADPRLLVGFRLQAETLLVLLRGLGREQDALSLEVAATDVGAGD